MSVSRKGIEVDLPLDCCYPHPTPAVIHLQSSHFNFRKVVCQSYLRSVWIHEFGSGWRPLQCRRQRVSTTLLELGPAFVHGFSIVLILLPPMKQRQPRQPGHQISQPQRLILHKFVHIAVFRRHVLRQLWPRIESTGWWSKDFE